jgi:hypothetical protein
VVGCVETGMSGVVVYIRGVEVKSVCGSVVGEGAWREKNR